jgi:hypothetical protein
MKTTMDQKTNEEIVDNLLKLQQGCQESWRESYFNWLVSMVLPLRDPEYPLDAYATYSKLLGVLFNTKFTYQIPMDDNRRIDGMDLRKKFADFCHISDEQLAMILNISDCTVLEMMIALAIKCEEEIMYDYREGDRASYWFTLMLENLGVITFTDSGWTPSTKGTVEEIVDRFLKREYEPNGKGGLFYIQNPKADLRTIEIWYQMCWYLTSISKN